MKKAAKMINKNGHLYLINATMGEELNFILQALSPDLEIKFETLIAHLIPRIPTGLVIGNSLLIACDGYSIYPKILVVSCISKGSRQTDATPSEK